MRTAELEAEEGVRTAAEQEAEEGVRTATEQEAEEGVRTAAEIEGSVLDLVRHLSNQGYRVYFY